MHLWMIICYTFLTKRQTKISVKRKKKMEKAYGQFVMKRKILYHYCGLLTHTEKIKFISLLLKVRILSNCRLFSKF